MCFLWPSAQLCPWVRVKCTLGQPTQQGSLVAPHLALLGQLLKLHKPQFSHLKNIDSSKPPLRAFGGIKRDHDSKF